MSENSEEHSAEAPENGVDESKNEAPGALDDAAADTADETGENRPTPEDQIADLNDQLLRSLAELENTRRRAERDRGEALKYGAMNFARDMVGVADNLARALKAIDDTDDTAKADLPEAIQALLEGVDATQRDLMAALARHRVTPLSPLGDKFDPNLHEAMFEAPGTGQAAGTIIEVVETGYVMEDRLLRPAKVGIAKD